MRTGFSINPSVAHYTATRELLEESATALFEVVSKQVVTINVNHRYPLFDVAQAHADLEARQTTGSIILLP